MILIFGGAKAKIAKGSSIRDACKAQRVFTKGQYRAVV
ncbi:hypothetical protein BPO_p0022 (plasmid) [Bergeyella porcorum]|uniref:Uncharacterized protein n=1 Tax=Bergeyella porcorum TaxID=1735111 RepID=A0AAU0F8G3_9FLAO